MDHKEKHHQQHKKEREHEDKLKKVHERQQEKMPRSIHPAWFVVMGTVLIILVLIIWTMI